MNQRFIYWVKYVVAISFSICLVGIGIFKTQLNTRALEITDGKGKSVVLYEQSHALLIYAGNYQHSVWSRLDNVESEAKQVGVALKQQGFQIIEVPHPTGDELRDAIKNFIDSYGYNPENRLVIFFAGHGYTRKKTKGYIVPVDSPNPIRDESGFLKAAISMQRVQTWAKEIEAKHVLFVFDSCFSGTVFKQRSANTTTNYILDVIKKPVRQFLTAGDADETVPAKSIFTLLFIRALNGNADTNNDGYVTGNELGLYLRQNLKEYDIQQTPQFGTIRDPDLDEGDIVFRSLKRKITSFQPNPPRSSTPNTDSKGSNSPLNQSSMSERHSVVRLRQKPKILSSNLINIILVQQGFYDKRRNLSGKGIAHQYETLVRNNAVILRDAATGLMWQKGGSSRPMIFAKANQYVNSLNTEKFAGFDDWRLPTAEEAMSLMEPQANEGFHIAPEFGRDINFIWTSDRTTDERIWTVYFYDGIISSEKDSFNAWVRAVRRSY